MHSLQVVAFTHKNLHLDELARLVVKPEQVASLLGTLTSHSELGMQEAMFVATCNRVEFIFTSSKKCDTGFAHKLLGVAYPSLPPALLSNLVCYAQSYSGKAAVEHLIRVASSLESLVVGEREICKQLRLAYDAAHRAGFTSDTVRLAIRQAILSSKEVYTKTRIAEKPISVASLASRALVAQGIKKSARIAFIGAGETVTLVAKYLLKQGYNHFTVFNRTLSRAEELAKAIDGQAFPMEAMLANKKAFDVIVTCTSAIDPLLTPEVFEALTQGNKANVLDLAVPADTHPDVKTNPNCHYIGIDNIRQDIETNLAFRSSEVTAAESIVQAGIAAWEQNMKVRSIELALSEFPQQVKDIKERAMREVYGDRIDSLSPEAKQLLEDVVGYLEKKCISVPIRIAKEKLLA